MFNRISDGVIRQTIIEQNPEVQEHKPAEDQISPQAEPIVQASPEYASGLIAERRLGGYAQEMFLRNQLNTQLQTAKNPISMAVPIEVPPQPPVTKIPPDNAPPPIGEGLEVGKGQSGLKTDPASLIPIPQQMGSNGEQVKLLQMELNRWRTNNGMEPLDVTGYFGKDTDKALKEFQRANNIKDDGIFGPISKHHLIVENNANFQQLPDNDKAAVRERMLQYGSDDPGRREAVVDFATRPDYLNCDSSLARTNALNYIDLPYDAMPFKGGEKDIKNLEDYLSKRTEMAQSENFQKLDQSTKDKIDEESNKYLRTPPQMEHLKNITASDAFLKLERDQDSILMGLRRIAYGGADRVGQFQNVLNNITGLDNTVKGRVLDAAYRNGSLDFPLQSLNNMVGSAVFQGATPDVQNSMMTTFFLLFPGTDIEIL